MAHRYLPYKYREFDGGFNRLIKFMDKNPVLQHANQWF